MWCCVGTGMENHSKYGHFIYTHEGTSTLYVNLFVASELNHETFGIRQETAFPYAASTKLTVTRAGTYSIAVRHPAWAGKEYQILVNHEKTVLSNVVEGTASYVTINRTWAVGDVITIDLPMTLRYEECPGFKD